MFRWLNLNITRQFLIFFLVTCILPIAIMSALFFQTLDSKFSERLARTLDIGLLFAQQTYLKDLERLSLSTAEASSLYLREDYQGFSRTGSLKKLEQTLNKYYELRNLDILNVYDAKGDLVAHAGTSEDLSHPSFDTLMHQALQGKTVSSVERFRFPAQGGRPDVIKLEYVSLAPIFGREGSGSVSGVLMTGQSLGENSSLQKFTDILPEMDLRIYVQGSERDRYQLLYSSLPGANSVMPGWLSKVLQSAPPQHMLKETDLSGSFEQKFGEEHYKNKALLLRNYLHAPIGLLIVSTSEKDLMELKLRNVMYVFVYLLFGLFVVGLTGVWFKRAFVDPVESLSVAADQVAEGDLDTRVQLAEAQGEIRKTIQSFNKMTEQLKEDQRLRDMFISTLTHDLRTPLIAQKRVLEIYEEMTDELPLEMVNLNVGLLKSNNHLLDMVNKMLETYQYEAGKIRLVPESVNLCHLVAECMEGVRGWAQQKNVTLKNAVPADLPPGHWDYDQMRRVFQNLIGNALENIQDDRQVEVAVVPTDLENLIRVEVRDNGPGIHPDILPLLFTRYFTGDRRRQKIGSGLGLYICSMIIALHGGSIHVESDLGEGTTFVIHLPWRIPANPNPTERKLI